MPDPLLREANALSVQSAHTPWPALSLALTALPDSPLLLTVYPRMPATQSRLTVWLSTAMPVPLLRTDSAHSALSALTLWLVTSHALTAQPVSGLLSIVSPRMLAIL